MIKIADNSILPPADDRSNDPSGRAPSQRTAQNSSRESVARSTKGTGSNNNASPADSTAGLRFVDALNPASIDATHADLVAECVGRSRFRTARINALRREIREGTFETPQRIVGTVERLLDLID